MHGRGPVHLAPVPFAAPGTAPALCVPPPPVFTGFLLRLPTSISCALCIIEAIILYVKTPSYAPATFHLRPKPLPSHLSYHFSSWSLSSTDSLPTGHQHLQYSLNYLPISSLLANARGCHLFTEPSQTYFTPRDVDPTEHVPTVSLTRFRSTALLASYSLPTI